MFSERILYMNLIIIASFMIFCVVFFIRLSHVKAMEAKADQEYWDRENRANFTRKKPLDNLNYITIPQNLIDMRPAGMTGEVGAILSELADLSASKIVNFTGYSNTDLKLEYGTANITILSEYDVHYTNLVTLLQKLAEKLHESGEDALAIQTLEFAVSTGTDVSKSYYLLADLYNESGAAEKIPSLIQSAEQINSLSKDNIIRRLQASM